MPTARLFYIACLSIFTLQITLSMGNITRPLVSQEGHNALVFFLVAWTVSDEMPLWPYCLVVHYLYHKSINSVLITHSITSMSPLEYKLRLEVLPFYKICNVDCSFLKFRGILQTRWHSTSSSEHDKMHTV